MICIFFNVLYGTSLVQLYIVDEAFKFENEFVFHLLHSYFSIFTTFFVFIFDLAVQDVEIEEKVDVIISEWMGYMLLYEVSISMLFLRIAFWCAITLVSSNSSVFFFCRVCCQVSYLQEINGLNLGVLFFLLMLRYNYHTMFKSS